MWGLDADTAGIRNRIVFPEETDIKMGTDRKMRCRLRIDDAEGYFILESCLFHLTSHESHGEFRTIDDWIIKCWQYIAESTNVIQVTVRDKDSDDLFFKREKKGDVGQTKFCSEFRVFWHLETSIDEKEFVLVLENAHVFPHLIMTAYDDESSMSRCEKRKLLRRKCWENRWKNIFVSKVARFFS